MEEFIKKYLSEVEERAGGKVSSYIGGLLFPVQELLGTKDEDHFIEMVLEGYAAGLITKDEITLTNSILNNVGMELVPNEKKLKLYYNFSF